MKKFLTFMLGLFLAFGVMEVTTFADTKEMRGAWVSTVYNMDWPSTTARNDISSQKQEFISLLDKLQECGLNTVVVQVRPKGDALYSSDINPWSDVLTGTQGKNPGYDPLAFMIEETHKRGMEFHAWFNPYRITTSGTDTSVLASSHPGRKNPSWVVSDGKALYYNPGKPEVIQHIVDTVSEVVKMYDVDAIHFDDYFYKGAFNDNDTYNASGTSLSKEDWRRANINTLISRVYSTIKSINSSVKFGVSPRGIWQNAASGTSGGQSYYDDYADSVKWIKNGWVDYIAPQVYWTFANGAAPYGKLVDWWSQQVQGTNVELYIGQAAYKDGSSSYPENVVAEIQRQVEYNRNNGNVDGSIYFSTRNILNSTSMQNSLKVLNAVEKIRFIGNTRYETSVEVSKAGWSGGADTVLIVNGYANADGITATPLASAYNGPILLAEQNNLTPATISEIKRLNPSKVILIGGTTVLSDGLVSKIKSINSSINVERLGGLTRYDTSLLIAQRLDTIVDVSKAYVCAGLGEADALSIAPKAGEEKAPIILSEKSLVPSNTLAWLRGEELQTAYFIGGTSVIYENVIDQINGITSYDVKGNRVSGINRYDTNGEVLKKFYPNAIQPSFFVTKGNILADALTASPLAGKLASPIVITEDGLSSIQKSILSSKQSDKLYEVGGGIYQTVIQDIINRIR